MAAEKRAVEFFVGLFLLIGIGVLATMVVVFGRLSQGMQQSYLLQVEFPNASGLVKGSDVLLSGARIGVVLDSPRLAGEHYAVLVPLRINATVRIPRTSDFQVRSNGLLGDSFVDIGPPARYTEADFAEPGERIQGHKSGGFEELAAKGTELVTKLNEEILTRLSTNLDGIQMTLNNLNSTLLSQKNAENVEATFANLRNLTAEFNKTSKDLDEAVKKGEEAIDSVKVTLRTVDASAGELKLALHDVRELAGAATHTVDSAKLLLNKASSGEGAVGMLISDKQMAADLRALVANLRRSGVLFYKDRPLPAPSPSPPAPGASEPRAQSKKR